MHTVFVIYGIHGILDRDAPLPNIETFCPFFAAGEIGGNVAWWLETEKDKLTNKVRQDFVPSSSIASFLVWGRGGGARPPIVPTQIYIYIYCASERLRNIYFQDFKIHLHTYTINAVSFNYLWYGAINDRFWQNTVKTEKKKKSMNMRASGAREFRKCSHFHILKLIFPSIFCCYFRYFVSETYVVRSHITSAYIHNQCNFPLSLMVWWYIQYTNKALTLRKFM